MAGRKDKVFAALNPKGKGLEIGPSHNPLAPKHEGYDVKILDHMDRAGLRAKYKEHGVNLDNIEEVDYVWKGEKLSELIGEKSVFDWIIASHVIEHTPDLIGFLKECDVLLKPDGVLSLVVPDKRYCFDFARERTSLAQVVDAHIGNRTIHSPGSAAEYFLSVVKNNDMIAWDKIYPINLSYVHTVDDAKNAIHNITTKHVYLDIHAWCFTCSSFRLLLHNLHLLGFLSLREICFFDTVGCEFYLSLSRNGQGPSLSRLELVEKIRHEV